MAYKSTVRVVLSQIEAAAVKRAASAIEPHARDYGLDGHEMNALARALDKLALGLANARGRDAEKRGAR
jgi:hypothetical protein